MQLPALSLIPLPLQKQDMVSRLTRLMWRDAVIDPSGGGLSGYLRGQMNDGNQAILFIMHGKPFSAASIEQKQFLPRRLQDFHAYMPHLSALDFIVTDPALFACTASLFGRAPSAILSSSQITPDSLVATVRTSPTEATLIVQAGETFCLVYCQGGELIAAYPSTDQNFPDTGTVVERIMAFANREAGKQQVSVYFIPDARPQGDPDAGVSLMQFFGLTESTSLELDEIPSLIVKMGERVLFQYPLEKGSVVIGRGTEADLILDNLSVSRKHATVNRVGGQVTILDVGSANGIIYKGNKVQNVNLIANDEVQIGKYTLIFSVKATDAPKAAEQMAPGASALSGTVMVGGGGTAVGGTLDYNGKKFPLTAMFFVIGTGNHVTLQIAGRKIAPAHVEISRGPSGYSVRHIDGKLPVIVNGAAVSEAQLRDGDQISVGDHVFRFSLR